MAHYNHWKELETDAAHAAIRRIRATGAVIRAQGPLIAHINDDPAAWGLPSPESPDGAAPRRPIWLPRGITFPWYVDDPLAPGIWRLNIRRPLSPAQIEHLARGYLGPLGITLMSVADLALRPLTGAVPPLPRLPA